MDSLPPVLRDSPVFRDVEGVERVARYLDTIEFQNGSAVVREGDADRDLYFVTQGEARIERSGVDVGIVEPGDHFGELSLIAARPRSASVIATGSLEVACLTHRRFAALSAQAPELALALVERMLTGLGTRLVDMTDTVEVLLRERSLPRRSELRIHGSGGERTVRTGTPLRDLLPEEFGGQLVVAGLVDRRPESLTSRITSDAEIRPLTTEHWEGLRVYRRSLGLLLLEAGRRAFPDTEFHLQHSIGFAQHIAMAGSVPPVPSVVAKLSEAMDELVEENRELREELWTVEEARAYFDHAGWAGSKELLRVWRDATVRMVSYGRVYAFHLSPFVDRTAMLTGFRLLPDDDGLLMVYGPAGHLPSDAREVVPPPPTRQATESALTISRHTRQMAEDHLLWLEALGTTTVGDFNRACIDGDVQHLIRVAEGYQEKRIAEIAELIAARGEEISVVSIAGPSSSGKTTFIKRLKVQLTVQGIHPIDLGLDDYYCDRDETPRDEHGQYDFEAFEAIQVDLLQEHLSRLVDGELVETARFDFQTGKSLPSGGAIIQLHGHDLLLLEGIHGLNPALLENLPAERMFRIFLCPLAQLPFDRLNRLHPSDLRLLRRIVRDRHGRGTDAADTIMRWPSVRRGERRHIFPYQQHADAVFDSSLIYEPSVLKVFAERYLLEVPSEHDAYTTAYRLLRVLDHFVTLYPDSVPPTSILREFIGGSGFRY
jgi:uridine kinase